MGKFAKKMDSTERFYKGLIRYFSFFLCFLYQVLCFFNINLFLHSWSSTMVLANHLPMVSLGTTLFLFLSASKVLVPPLHLPLVMPARPPLRPHTGSCINASPLWASPPHAIVVSEDGRKNKERSEQQNGSCSNVQRKNEGQDEIAHVKIKPAKAR